MSTVIRTLCIAALLFACAPDLVAQEIDPSCDAARTQAEMNECAGRTFQAQDSILNSVYPRVIAELDSARAPLLREAQRQWIRLRDADCAWDAAEFQGGSMYPMVHAFCMAHVTRERVAVLRRLLPRSAEEADDEQRVIETTEALFAAMRARDTTALRGLMHPRAQIVAVADNGVTVRSADEWLRGLSRTRTS